MQLGDIVKQGQRLAFVRSDDIAQIEADLLKQVLDFEADIQQARFQLALCEKYTAAISSFSAKELVPEPILIQPKAIFKRLRSDSRLSKKSAVP